MTQYTELLEEIVLEMRSGLAQGKTDIPEPHFLLWRNFLQKIKPESEVFRTELEAPLPREPSREAFPDIPQYSDIREIMLLAESNGYPTWHVQLKPKERVILEYVQGRLRESSENVQQAGMGVPKAISGFTGFIAGAWRSLENRREFVACDVTGRNSIDKKVEFLKECGFSVIDHVLFPTEKIQTTSSAKLETFFRNYISSANREGFITDGIVIIADTAIASKEGGMQVSFIPKS